MGRRIRTTLTAICVAMLATAALGAARPAVAAPAVGPAAAQDTTTAADPYCEATLTMTAQWTTGYAVAFGVRNVSSVPVRWRLVLRYPGPIMAAQVWNATYTQSGTLGTVVPTPPSGVLAPGQSVTAGIVYFSGGIIRLPGVEVTCTPA